MAAKRFDVIAAELDRLAAKIAMINSRPFDYRKDSRTEKDAMSENRSTQITVNNVVQLNARQKRGDKRGA